MPRANNFYGLFEHYFLSDTSKYFFSFIAFGIFFALFKSHNDVRVCRFFLFISHNDVVCLFFSFFRFHCHDRHNLKGIKSPRILLWLLVIHILTLDIKYHVIAVLPVSCALLGLYFKQNRASQLIIE